jgi:hypothetical protein
VLPVGVALALTGGSGIVVIVGSLIVLAALALFGWIVFRTRSRLTPGAPGARQRRRVAPRAVTDDHDPATPVA